MHTTVCIGRNINRNKKSTGLHRCSCSRQLASVEFFVKCFYSTSSSVNTLFTTVEWMAYVADFYFDIFFGSRSGFEFVTASADNFYSFILWVNTFSHLLHLFLGQSYKFHIKNYLSYTLQLDSILFPQTIVNYFFAGFSLFPRCIAQVNFIGCIIVFAFVIFCDMVWYSCQWLLPAVLLPGYSETMARLMLLHLTILQLVSWYPGQCSGCAPE